jgi:hypothetical protein
LLWDLICYAYEIWWWRHLRNRLISQAHKEDLQRRAVEIVLTADRRKQTLDPSYVRKPNASLPEPKKSKAEVEAARDAEIKNIDAETKKALEELKQAEGGPVPSRFVVAELTPPSAEESASPQVTSNSDCREPAGSDLVASSATEGAVPSTTNGSGSMELVPGKPPQGP